MASIQDYLYTTPIKPATTPKPIIPVSDLTINQEIRKTSQYPNIPPPTTDYNYTKGNYTNYDYVKDNLNRNIIEPILKPIKNPLDVLKPKINEIIDNVKDKSSGVVKNIETKLVYVIIGLVVFMLITNKK